MLYDKINTKTSSGCSEGADVNTTWAYILDLRLAIRPSSKLACLVTDRSLVQEAMVAYAF